jgi:hypothetical protein
MVSEGLKAYAEKQAALEDSIKVAWSAKWKAARDRARTIVDRVLGDGWNEGEKVDIDGSGPETVTVEVNIETHQDPEDDGSDGE